MKIAAKFEFVSKEQYLKDFEFKEDACEVYSKLKKPHRATAMSGIRAKMPEDYVLMIYPRSGLGFKYRLQLNNTVGVIDSDYYNALNEGHIMIKITNDSNEGKALDIKAGEGFAQGIFMQYGIVEDDDAKDIRVGGFGSTTK